MSDAVGPFVFDSSAVIALLLHEPGANLVQHHLDGGVMSVVNLAEVLAKLSDGGASLQGANRSVSTLGLGIVPMDIGQARRSAELRATTRAAGLSLGDRACLSLAIELNRPVLTADRQWSKVAAAVNVVVILIR